MLGTPAKISPKTKKFKINFKFWRLFNPHTIFIIKEYYEKMCGMQNRKAN